MHSERLSLNAWSATALPWHDHAERPERSFRLSVLGRGSTRSAKYSRCISNVHDIIWGDRVEVRKYAFAYRSGAYERGKASQQESRECHLHGR